MVSEMNLLLCVSICLNHVESSSRSVSGGLLTRISCTIPMIVFMCRWTVERRREPGDFILEIDGVGVYKNRLDEYKIARFNNEGYTEMPDEAFEASDVHTMNEVQMMHNGMKYLSEKISRFVITEVINLKNNKLEFLPDSIVNLPLLSKLVLNLNNFSRFPEQLVKIESLEWLDLSNNQISELPEDIGKLINIQDLWMNRNKLSKLPDSFAHLVRLEVLKLDRNEFSEFPEQLGSMRSLEKLFIGCNPIRRVKRSIARNMMNSKTLRHIEMTMGMMCRDTVKGDAEDGSDDMLGYEELIKVLGNKLIM